MAFQKGVTNNPHGRPLAGAALTDALRKFLEMPVEEFETYRYQTVKERIAYNLIALCESQGLGAVREVFDRIEGRAVQKQILVGEEGAPGIIVEFSSNGQGKIQPNAKAEPGNGDDAGAST
jgi:hypothetical protein